LSKDCLHVYWHECCRHWGPQQALRVFVCNCRSFAYSLKCVQSKSKQSLDTLHCDICKPQRMAAGFIIPLASVTDILSVLQHPAQALIGTLLLLSMQLHLFAAFDAQGNHSFSRAAILYSALCSFANVVCAPTDHLPASAS